MTFIESMIGTLLLILAGLLTNLVYRRMHLQSYGENKTPVRSKHTFSPWLDITLRATTFIFCLTSLWVDSPVLIQLVKDSWAFLGGSMAIILAELLFLFAMATLGTNYSPCYDAYVPQAMVTRGPYVWIRHPIYSANLLLVLGLTLMSGTLLTLPHLFVLGICYWGAARQEELFLQDQFAGYADYRRATGMFLPRLW